jgi:hypothetical protein
MLRAERQTNSRRLIEPLFVLLSYVFTLVVII